MVIIWIYDVERYFYTCSCPENQNVKFTLNILRLGAKDWWKFVTQGYFLADKVVVTWEQFSKMFRTKYVPLVERWRDWIRRIRPQAYDRDSDEDHHDVHGESFFLPQVCFFGVGLDVPILEYVKTEIWSLC